MAYIQDQNNFIADRVFPALPVKKQSDRYFLYPKGIWFRAEAQERAPGTESAGSGWTVDSTPTYFARIYAVHKDIDDPTRANFDDPLDADRDSTEWVTMQMYLRREKVWVANYFTTGVWGLDLTGVTAAPAANQFLRWDQAGSTPIQDIHKQVIRIAEQTGYRPNKLVLGPYVFNILRDHADVLDRIKYTQRGLVTQDILASLFGVDEVLIPYASENTAIEGEADTIAFIASKGALLVYSNPAPSILKPSGGYTFGWSGFVGAAQNGVRIKSFRVEPIESDRIEGEMAFDMKVVASDVATFFATAVS